MDLCPCGSGSPYADCCRPVISGAISAQTAEQLMRARYSAYAKKETEFLLTSLHPDHREGYDAKQTRNWAEKSVWEGLEIVATEGGTAEDDRGTVEFIASYTAKEKRNRHHERAAFLKHEGAWYFTDGEAVPPKTVVRETPKIGRNDPCPCGSGKKYKKCCGKGQ
ncbi:MAG: hypothetical protein COX19_17140 [Desulfobacterales bacterium CG23_combo_of_CG06-09_8_20_14_all_51_8]|nr:MAG: hypothetical protein COX19_17140 [Desulfobacterales bacterium CG23_combo_of_CG06-09_8_20_14_all_51_8]